MQQIERYGIIALLFLVVSIVVVALWDPEPAGPTEDVRSDQASTVAAAPARQQRAPAVDQQRNAQSRSAQVQSSQFSDRASAPATGTRGTRVAQANSAPLDLGGETAARRRGRNSNRSEQQASSSRPAMPVASQPTYSGPSSLTREKTRQNSGARRTAASVDAQRAADLSAGNRASAARTQKAQALARQKAQAETRSKPVPAKAALVSATTRNVAASQPLRASYVVRSGDSLERIARRELGDGARWREVAELNGIKNPNLVRVGQKLTLPGAAVASSNAKTRAPQAPARAEKTRAKRSGNTYVVAKGDVLSRIAERELGSSKRWREIVELNPGLDPAKLFVGKRLVMPGGASKAKPAPQPVAQPAPRNRVAQAAREPQDDSRFVVQ